MIFSHEVSSYSHDSWNSSIQTLIFDCNPRDFGHVIIEAPTISSLLPLSFAPISGIESIRVLPMSWLLHG